MQNTFAPWNKIGCGTNDTLIVRRHQTSHERYNFKDYLRPLLGRGASRYYRHCVLVWDCHQSRWVGRIGFYFYFRTGSGWHLAAVWSHSKCHSLFSGETASRFVESVDVELFMLGGGWRDRSAFYSLTSGKLTENDCAAE